jgi:hypothetical protein
MPCPWLSRRGRPQKKFGHGIAIVETIRGLLHEIVEVNVERIMADMRRVAAKPRAAEFVLVVVFSLGFDLGLLLDGTHERDDGFGDISRARWRHRARRFSPHKLDWKPTGCGVAARQPTELTNA